MVNPIFSLCYQHLYTMGSFILLTAMTTVPIEVGNKLDFVQGLNGVLEPAGLLQLHLTLTCGFYYPLFNFIP